MLYRSKRPYKAINKWNGWHIRIAQVFLYIVTKYEVYTTSKWYNNINSMNNNIHTKIDHKPMFLPINRYVWHRIWNVRWKTMPGDSFLSINDWFLMILWQVFIFVWRGRDGRTLGITTNEKRPYDIL